MAFAVQCPECRVKLLLDEAPGAGEGVECPKCGTVFAPSIPPAKQGSGDRRADAAPREKIFADDDEPAPASRRSQSPAKDRAARRSEDRPPGRRDSETKGPPAERSGKTKKSDKSKKSIDVKPDKNPNNKGKKRAVRKKKTNPAVLLAALAFGFLGVAGVFAGMVFLLGQAGGVTEMLSYVPKETNWVRGVNVAFMAKFPGYADQVNKFKTPAVDAAVKELAKTSGLNEDTFLDYLVIAKNRQPRSTTTMYLMRTNRAYDPAKIANGLTGGSPATIGGIPGAKFDRSAPGILSGATALFPRPRLVIIVPGSAAGLAEQSAALAGNSEGSFANDLTPTIKTTIKGSIWLVIKGSGALQNYLDASLVAVNQDFKQLYEKGKSAPVAGVWTTPGAAGVRVGAGFQCTDANAASELVRFMKEGPLGKEDESEPTNQMKSAGIQFLLEKRTFGEFMQYLEFRSNGDCAYILSTVSGENAKRLLDAFNNPAMGSDEGAGAFGGGGGPPIGGGGPPSRPGLPGGIATPGMGP